MCLAGKDIARLVGEEDMLVVYHCMNNDRKKHASAPDGADDEVNLFLASLDGCITPCEGWSRRAFAAY